MIKQRHHRVASTASSCLAGPILGPPVLIIACSTTSPLLSVQNIKVAGRYRLDKITALSLKHLQLPVSGTCSCQKADTDQLIFCQRKAAYPAP